jgi:signal transduction histidine kinase
VKNLKAHHHLAIVSLLLFGMSSVWAWGTIVFASTSGTQVQVNVGPPDSCPNIPGYQSELPEGMLIDENGNCYTPPPPPTDVCGNIDGNQETIPEGYYRDNTNGNCYKQPTPPVDVCPNLEGLQTSVPDGYVVNEDGTCTPPPADMCENIPGPQPLVPEGMEQAENKTCFTPAPVDSPLPPAAPANPDTPRRPPTVIGEHDLKNIPAPLENIVQPLVNAIPEPVKEVLRSVPPEVARTFPYYVLGTLAGAGAVMGWQSLNEVVASRKLAALLRREREIAEEKDTFIALASHYLRTPLTLMKGALSTAVAMKETTEESLAPLSGALTSLDTKIGEILAAVEENAALTSIKPPTKEKAATNFLRSTFFWLPVVAMVVIVLLSNFLLGVVGEVDLGTFNLITQTIVFASVSIFFYSTVRSFHLRKIDHAYRKRLLEHEEIVDRARNEFIEHTAAILATELAAIKTQQTVLGQATAARFFEDGLSRFEHLLRKFGLLGEIQAGIVGAVERFDIKATIDMVVETYQPQLAEKQLTIINNVKNVKVSQRRTLFEFVLGSLIDNAVKFSHEGGTIVISSSPHEKTLTVQVVDHGIGIPEEKISTLFKPFSRGTSTMEFNYEGLGFSLFLDKIIMDYIGGSISAKSTADQGTTVTMTAKTV